MSPADQVEKIIADNEAKDPSFYAPVSVRVPFVEDFGEDQAAAIEAAAEEHKNGVHDKPGSDYFRWALAIAIGFECMERPSFREYHGITAPWRKLRPWIKNNGRLAEHDGDVDYMSLLIGTYNYYVGKPTPRRRKAQP